MFEIVPKVHKVSPLWNITNILTGKKSFTFPPWATKGIHTLGDIYSENSQRTDFVWPTLFHFFSLSEFKISYEGIWRSMEHITTQASNGGIDVCRLWILVECLNVQLTKRQQLCYVIMSAWSKILKECFQHLIFHTRKDWSFSDSKGGSYPPLMLFLIKCPMYVHVYV